MTTLLGYARARDPVPLLGAGLFVGLLAGGYYYNITFVQLGLVDLGTRLVGLSRDAVAVWMAVLAVLTVVVALVTGWTMDRRGWSRDVRTKLRLVTGVVALQFVLTLVAPWVRSVPAFGAWVVVCSVSLGVGVPASFGLTTDLVPVPDRGRVAGAATAIAFGLGAVYPLEWSVEGFSRVMVAAIAPAVLALGYLAFRENPLVERWATQHETFGTGRFRRTERVTARTLTFWTLVVLMFGVFFIDSLGFLRIVETPALVGASWQSPDFGVHVLIAVVHVVGAGAAAVLYRNFGREWVFLWAFGTFAVTHLLYTTAIRAGPVGGDGSPLATPLFYALAVSVYTTLNFALWADVSTPDDVGLNTAIGVGVAGWTATFLSTALALRFRESLSLLEHLNLTNALALGLTLLVGALLYARWALRGREVAGWS